MGIVPCDPTLPISVFLVLACYFFGGITLGIESFGKP